MIFLVKSLIILGKLVVPEIFDLQEHKRAFKSGDIYAKLIIHGSETGHISDFDNAKITKSNYFN